MGVARAARRVPERPATGRRGTRWSFCTTKTAHLEFLPTSSIGGEACAVEGCPEFANKAPGVRERRREGGRKGIKLVGEWVPGACLRPSAPLIRSVLAAGRTAVGRHAGNPLPFGRAILSNAVRELARPITRTERSGEKELLSNSAREAFALDHQELTVPTRSWPSVEQDRRPISVRNQESRVFAGMEARSGRP
jgi:hypothetical protein